MSLQETIDKNWPIKFLSPEGWECRARTKKDPRTMVSLEGYIIKSCGYLWGQALVGAGIDSGWATGEYGERMGKKEAMEWAKQIMGQVGDRAENISTDVFFYGTLWWMR